MLGKHLPREHEQALSDADVVLGAHLEVVDVILVRELECLLVTHDPVCSTAKALHQVSLVKSTRILAVKWYACVTQVAIVVRPRTRMLRPWACPLSFLPSGAALPSTTRGRAWRFTLQIRSNIALVADQHPLARSLCTVVHPLARALEGLPVRDIEHNHHSLGTRTRTPSQRHCARSATTCYLRGTPECRSW